MNRIAGHTFIEQIGGSRCECGMRWSLLLSATNDCIGQEGWAHLGRLSALEYSEIDIEKTRVFDALKT